MHFLCPTKMREMGQDYKLLNYTFQIFIRLTHSCKPKNYFPSMLTSLCYRFGLPFPHVLSRSILQASWRKFLQGKDCRFLLYALIWCYCLDRHRTCWRDDTLRVWIFCQNHFSQQFVDFYDGNYLFCICISKLMYFRATWISGLMFWFLTFAGLCLEQEKSIYSYELLGSLYFYSGISTMG